MLIFTSNHSSSKLHFLAGQCHAKGIQILGHLWSPGRVVNIYNHLFYAFDNGCYRDWKNGASWNEDAFRELCRQIPHLSKPPLFLTVPDAIRDLYTTQELWREWEPKLRRYQIPLAYVLQDGVTVEQIPETADVWFIGGSDQWRFPRLHDICQDARKHKIPVHVGRVHGKRIWDCHNAGASSVDGTGYFRGPHMQVELERYLDAHLKEQQTAQQQQLDLFTGQSEYLSYFVLFPAHLSVEMVLQHQQQVASLSYGKRIPDYIQKEHLIQAMRHWRSLGGTPPRQRPVRYAIRYQGRDFPVKLVIARAHIYASQEGVALPTRSFSGGAEEANRFVLSRGLKIVDLREESYAAYAG